ncbi:MAG TPA: hypothetical protein HPP56_02255, partial [Nitrospirae bacterium]|nr:hypothetical protein [Nitrospirota bacterium]
LGTFFIRCRIKILHQPFLSYLLILLSFLVLSLFLGHYVKISQDFFYKVSYKNSSPTLPT